MENTLIEEFFRAYYLYKPKCTESTLYRETKVHYEKRVLLLLIMSFSGMKTLKPINSTLYEKRNITRNVYFECFFFFTLLLTKIPKYIQIITYGETKGHYEKRVL